MTPAKKPKGVIIQTSLRLPRPLWVRITRIAVEKNLSMAQAVQEAVVEYCRKIEAERGE
jgi:predicted DNA-binding ribbon-helix-helix protein